MGGSGIRKAARKMEFGSFFFPCCRDVLLVERTRDSIVFSHVQYEILFRITLLAIDVGILNFMSSYMV